MKKETKEPTPHEKKTLVLIDAHAIIHRAYHALPDFATSSGEPTGALYGLSTMLIKILAELKPDYIAACYDLPGKTYRHEAYEGYKAQRKKTPDDLVAQLIRSREVFQAFNIPMYELAGFEADDMLGTIVEKMKGRKDIQIIIASGDMDTLQLVDDKKVQVYTLKKGIQDTILYDEEAVLKRFGFGPKLLPDYKGLRGDPSDNIIGIAGIGEKTATTLITSFGTIEEIYAALAKDKQKVIDAGVTARIVKLLEDGKEEAEFSKMLATIRRDAGIEFSLPAEEWRKTLSIETLEALFKTLQFRSLGARVREVFFTTAPLLEVDVPKKELPTVPEKELKEVLVSLWLVDSTKTNPTLEDVLAYAETADFEKAKEVIFAELQKKKLENVFRDIEFPLIPILEKIKERGIVVDAPYLKKLDVTYSAELAKLEREIWKHAGSEFNIASPKQLGVVLFDTLKLEAKNLKKTPGGKRSTRESELEKLVDVHPIVKLIMEYRELAKLLSTYIKTIPLLLDSESRLHTTLISAGSTTGRMASENPNLQNIPIKTELGRAIRNAFVASDGFKLVAFDYSQIELRIAAFLSGDEKLIDIFKKGLDVHTAVAAQVFAVPEADVTYEMRRRAKVINFGILYGMGVNALRANLGTDRAEAQKFYATYFETFSTLAAYLDGLKALAARQGYTETFFGRRRYFEGMNSKIPYIRAAAERMAVNAPIQGTEADIVKLAMIRVDEWSQKEKLAGIVYPLLQVHDEIIYEVADAKVDDVVKPIKKIMESILTIKESGGVPIVVEASVGKNWGEMEHVGK